MSLTAVVVIHELLCLALFYTVFCRAVRTCEKVRTDVRLAFFALGIVALAGIAAPLVWGLVPDLFGLALLVVMVAVQAVTAHHWCEGVPDRFYKPEHAPRNRRACDIPKGRQHAH